MDADDFFPSRLEVAKNIVEDFVQSLNSDRLSLVVFAGKPLSSLPLTFDYEVISNVLDSIVTDTIDQSIIWYSGTSIWDALLLSKSILQKDDEKRKKVVILITDWDANSWVDTKLASDFLSKDSIIVHTIWIWTKEGGYIDYDFWPFTQRQKVSALNEEYLKEISFITWWKFFRADSEDSLDIVFDELEKLEKTKFSYDVHTYFRADFSFFVNLLIFFMFTILFLEYFYFRV